MDVSVMATEIREALEALPGLPVEVDSWQVETGGDWADDPAIWVWGILADPALDKTNLFALRKTIRDTVRDRAGDEISIYIRFRSTSELAQTQ